MTERIKDDRIENYVKISGAMGNDVPVKIIRQLQGDLRRVLATCKDFIEEGVLGVGDDSYGVGWCDAQEYFEKELDKDLKDIKP